MTDNISNATVRQFTDDVIILVQQEESRLVGTVKQKSITGDRMYFERLGSIDVMENIGRFSPTVLQDADHSRRLVKIKDYDGGLGLDPKDELRMLIDPKSDYARILAMGMGRQLDKTIIAAAAGLSESSTTADLTEATVALPAGNIIDQAFGAGSDNLSVEKLREAKKKLDENEVGSTEERVCIVTASNLDALLGTTEVTSSDFNTVKALVQGEIETFLGFRFIRTELLENQSEGFRQVLCYTKSAIGLAMADDMKVMVDRRPDLKNIWQVLIQSTFGAVRIEEEKVIVIECDES